MRKVKSFSVDDVLDLDVINHLEKQSNASEYIKRLIRADIVNGSKALTEEQKTEVKRIVLEIIKDKDISIHEEKIDKDIINALDQF
jgi:hypothetical protein